MLSSAMATATFFARNSMLRMPCSLQGLHITPFAASKRHVLVRAAAPVPLPPQYGYVVLTTAASYVLTQWQAFQVGGQRRKSGIAYPKMYEDAESSIFNCYQRAHQNTLESYPAFLAMLIVGGLAYPITSAAFGMLWVIGRLIYSLGYYTGDPAKRLRGSFNYFGLFGLLGVCIVFGVKQVGLLPP